MANLKRPEPINARGSLFCGGLQARLRRVIRKIGSAATIFFHSLNLTSQVLRTRNDKALNSMGLLPLEASI